MISIDIEKFQFHKGTIKTAILCLLPTSMHYFNSIKVRLKRKYGEIIVIISKFQFHKGTIKTIKSE